MLILKEYVMCILITIRTRVSPLYCGVVKSNL